MPYRPDFPLSANIQLQYHDDNRNSSFSFYLSCIAELNHLISALMSRQVQRCPCISASNRYPSLHDLNPKRKSSETPRCTHCASMSCVCVCVCFSLPQSQETREAFEDGFANSFYLRKGFILNCFGQQEASETSSSC